MATNLVLLPLLPWSTADALERIDGLVVESHDSFRSRAALTRGRVVLQDSDLRASVSKDLA